jgi:hypothetical protein
MPAKSMRDQVLAHAFAGLGSHGLACIFRHGIEEMRWPFGEILVVHPARVDQREIEMIFQHALDRPGLRALLGRKTLVEIEGIFFLDMGADERRIAETFFTILDIGDLAFWRAGRRARSKR